MSKLVLLTGGARGLGRAMRAKFEAAGHRVLAPGREDLDLAEAGAVASYLRDHADTEVDILVNNAGINRPADISLLSVDEFRAANQVNLIAPFQLIQHFSGGMKRRGWGRVVNVGSIFSSISRPGRAAYASTKAGLLALTKTAALELGPFNILVNCVCPGFVGTEMTERNNSPDQLAGLKAKVALKRLARPEEIAEVVFFLASEQNSFMTGAEVLVDGGFMAGLTE